MKSYWKIDGIKGIDKDLGQECIAFDKHDGSNLRFVWGKKLGWHQFGTRTRELTESDPDFGSAIDLFKNKYGEQLIKIFTSDSLFKSVSEVTVYCEFVGKNSFAGYHDPKDTKDVVLFEVNPHKKGFVSAVDFVNIFGSLHIPDVVYQGPLTKEFIDKVYNGEIKAAFEGVVAKWGSGHKIGMRKIKTKAWIDQLKVWAVKYPERFKQALQENLAEQVAI